MCANERSHGVLRFSDERTEFFHALYSDDETDSEIPAEGDWIRSHSGLWSARNQQLEDNNVPVHFDDDIEDEDNEIEGNRYSALSFPMYESSDSDEENDPDECMIEIDIAEDIPYKAAGDYEKVWCKNLNYFPPKLTFTATPGLQSQPNLPPWEECRPLDFFKLFIDTDILELMATETNRYASQTLTQEIAVKLAEVSETSWTPVTVQEITSFLAVLIHMSVVKKPRIQDYWAEQSILQTPFVPRVMTSGRFIQILAFFHLNDNSKSGAKGQTSRTVLHKVRPLLDHLNSRFKMVYIPEQQMFIEEAFCSWRGRDAIETYMKDNQKKRGIKLYELCESHSGYVYNFEVLCKSPGISNKSSDMVKRLLQPLEGLGYTVYVNSQYCSVGLAQHLSLKNTGMVAMVRPDQNGLPKDFMSQPMEKGEVDFRRLKNILVLRWKDQEEVAIISTIHTPQMVSFKTQVREKSEVKKKPKVVVDYSRNMSGSIRTSSFTPLLWKYLKCWKTLAFYLLTLTLTQAHCLYVKAQKAVGKPEMCLEDFMVSVGEDLVTSPAQEDEDAVVPEDTTTAGNDMLRLTERHFLEPCAYRNCVVCYARARANGVGLKDLRNKVKRSSFQCQQCRKSLCPYPCMEIYHTKRDFAKDNDCSNLEQRDPSSVA